MKVTISCARLFLLPLLGFSGASMAAEEVKRFGGAIPELSLSMMTQFGVGLALVVSLIFALAWVSKKIRGRMNSDLGSLKIVAGLALGARERLLLVQVYDQQLLIGIAPGQVSMLHVLQKGPGSNMGKNTFDDPPPPLSDFLAKVNRQIRG